MFIVNTLSGKLYSNEKKWSFFLLQSLRATDDTSSRWHHIVEAIQLDWKAEEEREGEKMRKAPQKMTTEEGRNKKNKKDIFVHFGLFFLFPPTILALRLFLPHTT